MSIIVSGQEDAAAVTVFEDHMYWTTLGTDWRTSRTAGSIYRADRAQGTNTITVATKLDRPWSIHMYHPDRQAEG